MSNHISWSLILIMSMVTISLLFINSVNNSIFLNIDQQALAAQTIKMKQPESFVIDNIANVAMINSKATNFSIYRNLLYGIEIKYPVGWQKLEFSQSNTDGLVVGFAVPREGKPLSEINVSDFVLENIMIGVTRIISAPSSFSKNTILGDFVNDQISSYKQELADFQIIKSNITGIDNNPAYQIQFTHKDRRATFDTLQIWTISGNKIYTILFNADPADYPTYLPIIQKMTDSFVIFNNNNNNNNNNEMKFRNT
jgi:hypothetical protein